MKLTIPMWTVAFLFACVSDEVGAAIADARQQIVALEQAQADPDTIREVQIRKALLEAHGAAALDVEVTVDGDSATLAGNVDPRFAYHIVTMSNTVSSMTGIEEVRTVIETDGS